MSKIFFSNSFPKKRSDCESQKSGFGFDPKNPPRESWIHDSFLDLPPKTQNPFLDFPKKRALLIRCDYSFYGDCNNYAFDSKLK